MTKQTKNVIASAVAFLNGEVSLSRDERLNLASDLEKEVNSASPWYIVLLKTLAYLIGLVLAGYGTSAAACTLFHI